MPELPKILIIADSTYNLQGIVARLHSEPYILERTRNPIKGRSMFWEMRPELLLLGFRTVQIAKEFYSDLIQIEEPELIKAWHQVIVLCHMKEAEVAFGLVTAGLFDDYCAIQPVYDAHRMVLSIKNALNRQKAKSHIKSLESELAETRLSLQQAMAVRSKVGENIGEQHNTPQATKEEIRRIVEGVASGVGFANKTPETEKQPETTAQNQQAEASEPRTILVVDDEDAIRSLFSRILKDIGGYHVTEARNLTTAWLSIMKTPPDLMLINLELNGENGLALVRKCKNTPELSHVPVFIVSGHSERSNVIESSRAGAEGFIVKPVKPSDLLKTVQQALRAHSD